MLTNITCITNYCDKTNSTQSYQLEYYIDGIKFKTIEAQNVNIIFELCKLLKSRNNCGGGSKPFFERLYKLIDYDSKKNFYTGAQIYWIKNRIIHYLKYGKLPTDDMILLNKLYKQKILKNNWRK